MRVLRCALCRHRWRAYVTNRLRAPIYKPVHIHEGCIILLQDGSGKSTHIHRHPRVAELGGDRVRRTRLQTAAPPAIHLPKYPPSPQCLPLTARTTNKEETDGRFVLYMLSLYLVYPLVGRHCVLPYTSSFVSFIVMLLA